MDNIDWKIDSFDDAVEYIADAVGGDFIKAINGINRFLDDPSSYTGPQALFLAAQIAGYRVKIGTVAQYWKLRSANTKKLQDRLVKDALMNLYDGLEEQIMTLKLWGRYDHRLADA